MTRPPTRKLILEALEDRTTPVTGTFVEDFTHDVQLFRGGFDTYRDGVQISSRTLVGAIVSTPASGPAGKHSLKVMASKWLEGHYLGWTYHTAQSGGLAPWEMVTAASITVRGRGTVTFTGNDDITFTNTAPADQWVTFAVTKDTLGENGTKLGEVTQFRVATTSEILVDDVTVVVGHDPRFLHPGDGEVRVARFGNGLGVYGSAKNDLVRVEYRFDEAGTVRVTGLSGTRVRSLTPDLSIQVSDSVVEVPGFAHIQRFDNDNQPIDPERDLLIHLHGGDDLLEVDGVTEGMVPLESIDDLFITTGSGESFVSLTGNPLWGSLSVTGGGGSDQLGIAGPTHVSGINVRMGAGDDRVEIGEPGAKVFDDEATDGVEILGRNGPLNQNGVQVLTDGLFLGPGNDTVRASGWLSSFTVHMGAGADGLRFESVRGDNLRVVPGDGIRDLVQFVETNMASAVWMLQDARDIIQLHRVYAPGFGFFDFRGASPVYFELPNSGTRIRPSLTGNYELTRTTDPEAVRDIIFALGLPSRLRLGSFVVFTLNDF